MLWTRILYFKSVEKVWVFFRKISEKQQAKLHSGKLQKGGMGGIFQSSIKHLVSVVDTVLTESQQISRDILKFWIPHLPWYIFARIEKVSLLFTSRIGKHTTNHIDLLQIVSYKNKNLWWLCNMFRLCKAHTTPWQNLCKS